MESAVKGRWVIVVSLPGWQAEGAPKFVTVTG